MFCLINPLPNAAQLCLRALALLSSCLITFTQCWPYKVYVCDQLLQIDMYLANIVVYSHNINKHIFEK